MGDKLRSEPVATPVVAYQTLRKLVRYDAGLITIARPLDIRAITREEVKNNQMHRYNDHNALYDVYSRNAS